MTIGYSMSTYEELKARADGRWRELTEGDKPWIRIGSAMCGHAAGAFDVRDAIKSELESRGIDANVDDVGCLGICYAEPLVDIQKPGGSRVFFNNVTPDDVPNIVQTVLVDSGLPDSNVLGYLGGAPVDGVADLNELPGIGMQQRIALRNAGNIAPADVMQYIANGGYSGLQKALFEMQPEEVIKEVIDSGLRGRGGAAFPTGVKWNFMARGDGPKYILCNCEEGDPARTTTRASLRAIPIRCWKGCASRDTRRTRRTGSCSYGTGMRGLSAAPSAR